MAKTASRRAFMQIGVTAAGALTLPTRARSSSVENTSMKRAEQLKTLVQCLGGPWPQPGPLNVRTDNRVQKEGYRIEFLTFEAEPGDRIPALLLIPDRADAAHPAPAIAVWHQHNGEYHLGKSEPAGLAGNPRQHTGAALAKEGYVVICPDALCFEERQDPTGKLKGGEYERFEFLRHVVNGRCMAWKNILDMRRTVDVLCARPEVDAARIGCYGHSMGSTHTWLVGPHEPRLKALVGNCCLPTYDAIHDRHMLHCFPNFVPGWKQHGDTPDIAALIAPRALHLNFGELDDGSPIEYARKGIARIGQAYAEHQAAHQFSTFIEPGAGHVLSEAMWQRTKSFFATHLG